MGGAVLFSALWGHCGGECGPPTTSDGPEDKRKGVKRMKDPHGAQEEQLVAIDMREEQRDIHGLLTGGALEWRESFIPLFFSVVDVNLLDEGKFINLSSFWPKRANVVDQEVKGRRQGILVPLGLQSVI